MYRMVKLGYIWYATKINYINEADILEFVNNGEVVLLGEDLEKMAEAVSIEKGDIKIVD